MASEAASQISVGALRYAILPCHPAQQRSSSRSHTDDDIYSAIFDQSKPQVPQPIVQCVQIKSLPAQPGQAERYRAVFSDIQNYVQTMLATRMFMALSELFDNCY
jgi:hypothetical protein